MSAVRTAARAAVPALALALLAAPAARAELEPLRLASTSAQEQADVASEPAISADGRFLAFTGRLGGLRGVFRKDLLSGDVALVAGGDAYAGATGGDAAAPSISADGRRVSFTTAGRLDPADDAGPGTSDVYVRDMDRPAPADGACASGEPCAYELASALDAPDASCPAGVTTAAPGTPTGIAGGAEAAPRVALSADGRRVAFVTAAESDLTSGPDGSTPGVPTPAGQVVLRDLAAGCSTLVSARRDDATGAMTTLPVDGGGALRPGGAAISADGTTVAWTGAGLPAQVPLLADERDAVAFRDTVPLQHYTEPLWRRVADGPAAPTRRVVGGGDPLAPDCPADGTLADVRCQGPFPDLVKSTYDRDTATGWIGLRVNRVPQLSADGRTVALLGDPSGIANVFVVDMRQGLTRREALRQLTREVPLVNPALASSPANIGRAGDLWDVGISPDGRRIGIATARNTFPLAPPAFLDGPLTQLGLLELFRIDLAGEALERVTRGLRGAPSLSADPALAPQSADGASAPSFSADGSVLAFASEASNRVAGDANDASDVFLSVDRAVSHAPGTVEISPAPRVPLPPPRWRLQVTATARADGSVRVAAIVPGAGTLRLRASALVAGAARRARHPLVRRTVAATRTRARRDGALTATLRPARRWARRARSRTGLQATVQVAFAAPRRRALRDELDVRFRVRPQRSRGR